MGNMPFLCRSATTFSKSGELDEDAFRKYLQRFVDANVGVYLASGGSGEGDVLSKDELRRVYAIGVEVCKGRVPVNANIPEGNTAKDTIKQAKLAIEAGVEVVNIYGPAGAHGFRPHEDELAAYFDEVLSAVDHPVALAPNPVMGYTPTAAFIAGFCDRYSQVVAVNLSGLGDAYFIDLKDALKRDVAIYAPLPGSLHMLTLGATGLIDAHANIIPKSHRHYLDLYESGDFDALALVYADLHRYRRYMSKWGAVRSYKMAMRVLKLPGSEGSPRPPYLMPADDEIEKFANGMLQLRLPEIHEMAQAAGLAVPA